MSNENTKSRPSHRIYAVVKNGDKKFWQPIGALWAHQDGKGFNRQLDYLPLKNDVQIVRFRQVPPCIAEGRAAKS
jgi:hypothetical protein